MQASGIVDQWQLGAINTLRNSKKTTNSESFSSDPLIINIWTASVFRPAPNSRLRSEIYLSILQVTCLLVSYLKAKGRITQYRFVQERRRERTQFRDAHALYQTDNGACQSCADHRWRYEIGSSVKTGDGSCPLLWRWKHSFCDIKWFLSLGRSFWLSTLRR